MVATAAAEPVSPAPEPGPTLAVVPELPGTEVEIDAEQAEAEHSLLRSALVGVGVGMVVCSALWALLVIALAGTGAEMGAWVAMGAGVGIFAGVFYGGWLGTVLGCKRLEEAEHHQLPRVS